MEISKTADSSIQPAEPGTHSNKEIAAINTRLDAGDERMARIERSLKENTDATARVESNTSELVDGFNSFKAAFKVLNWVGKLAKPLSAIVGLGAAVAAAWTAMKSGASPK